MPEPVLRRGLLRLLAPEEMMKPQPVREPEEAEENTVIEPGRELAELTAVGLALVAAQQGLSLPAAVRLTGLAGAGPGQGVASRRKLLGRNLAHTLGTDAVFIKLLDTAREFRARGHDDALLEWRNATACSRRHLRPDGYRHRGRLYGFFLEYDRGTMSVRAYLEKFGAYYAYRDSRLFERKYVGLPTILVVTTSNAAEERLARAARAAAVGRGPELPLLLTCVWRIEDKRNPSGLLGPIWREPETTTRRSWPIGLRGIVGPSAGPGRGLMSYRVNR